MIVLDATNKSLKVMAGPSGLTITSVIAYWSIDSSNVWTPRTFEVASTSVSALGVTILPAPGAGEVSRVVESVWINNTIAASGDVRIQMDVGGTPHTLATFGGSTLLPNTTITLDRSGAFTRQVASFAGAAPTASTQNVH